MPERAAAPTALPALVAALAATAAAAAWAAAVLTPAPQAPWTTAVALVVPLVAAGALHVELRHGDDVDALDLFEAAVAPAIFLFPGAAAVLLVAAGKAVAEAALRVAPHKAAFNVAQWSAAAGVGSLVFELLRPDGAAAGPSALVALAVALVAVSAVNTAAVVAVLALTQRRPVRSVVVGLRPTFAPAWLVGVVATLGLGTVLAAAVAWAPVTAVLAVVPLVFLHWSSRGQAVSASDLEHLRGLQRATHVLATTVEPSQVFPRYVDEVRRAFHADAAELAVQADDGIVVYRATADHDGARVEPAPWHTVLGAAAADLTEPVRVTSAAQGRLAEILQVAGWRELLVAPLDAGQGTGMLSVANPGGLAGSVEADTAVLTALAREAAGALERGFLVETMMRSEARFRALVQHASDFTVVVDEEGTVVERVPGGAALGLPEEAVAPGVDLRALVHPDDLPAGTAVLADLARHPGAVETVECRVRDVRGRWRHVEAVATNLCHDPAVGGIVLTCRDVTHRTRAAALLTCQTDILRAIALATPLREVLGRLTAMLDQQAPGARASVFTTDVDDRLRQVAGAPLPAAVVDVLAERLAAEPGRPVDGAADDARVIALDDDPTAPLGTDPAVRPLDDLDLRALCAVRIDGGDGRPLGVVTLSFDRPRSAESHEVRLLHLAGRLLHVAAERVRAQQRLVEQATRDPLTGLPNRLVFLDRAEVALARLERTRRGVAVVFVDLDRFKVINDSLGHDAGDRLLTLLGHRLHEAMRTNDTVARFGGDEFTILCDDVGDDRELTVIADRIRHTVAQPALLDGHEVSVTASLGIAHTHDPRTEPASLIDNADTAMYRAKARGGNRSEVFDPALRTRALRDLVTHNALRASIDAGHLRVHYQPVVSIDEGRVVGVEALVRWEHPELGLVPPGDFVPLAEQTGLIIPIGDFVLQEACRQSHRWQQVAGADFTTSVNLSARQFADPTLATSVAETLERTGVPPERIIFEITETVLMENLETTSATMRQLTDLGVDLRIDDFGTGYSSLSYLKRFPVGGLKIDRSFVAGLGDDPDDSAIVSAVVSLAHSLGMLAVAEGVETAEQLERLRALGCDVAQGYYFSRPVPADDLTLDTVFS